MCSLAVVFFCLCRWHTANDSHRLSYFEVRLLSSYRCCLTALSVVFCRSSVFLLIIIIICFSFILSTRWLTKVTSIEEWITYINACVCYQAYRFQMKNQSELKQIDNEPHLICHIILTNRHQIRNEVHLIMRTNHRTAHTHTPTTDNNRHIHTRIHTKRQCQI